MQIQDILYYVFWAGLFFVMMRFGCGAHIMGHGHHHAAAVPDPAPGTGVKPPVPERVTDPVCGMNVQTSVAKAAAYRSHCVSAPKSGPHADRLQLIDPT